MKSNTSGWKRNVYSNNIFKIWFNKNGCSIPDWVASVRPLHQVNILAIIITESLLHHLAGRPGGVEAGGYRGDCAEQSNEKQYRQQYVVK